MRATQALRRIRVLATDAGRIFKKPHVFPETELHRLRKLIDAIEGSIPMYRGRLSLGSAEIVRALAKELAREQQGNTDAALVNLYFGVWKLRQISHGGGVREEADWRDGQGFCLDLAKKIEAVLPPHSP